MHTYRALTDSPASDWWPAVRRVRHIEMLHAGAVAAGASRAARPEEQLVPHRRRHSLTRPARGSLTHSLTLSQFTNSLYRRSRHQLTYHRKIITDAAPNTEHARHGSPPVLTSNVEGPFPARQCAPLLAPSLPTPTAAASLLTAARRCLRRAAWFAVQPPGGGAGAEPSRPPSRAPAAQARGYGISRDLRRLRTCNKKKT